MILTYDKAIDILTSQGRFYINLGLERISELLNLLDNPQEKIKIIHIAGTNGKGSVCAILSNILYSAGYKTGLYISPHLIEYTERIKINNIEISQKDFTELTDNICTLADKNNIPLTEFEILTACAFKYFADNNVEYAVMETGLGGRFDAVNVCKNPVLSVITSISKDHTDRLGTTIEQIAFEKAGIIKNNSAVIVSTENKGFEIIRKTAKEKNTKLLSVHNNIEMNYENGINHIVYNNEKYEFPLLGLYQKQNLALVFKAVEYLKINKNAVKKGLKTVQWAARLEFLKDKNIIIDGAHNPDAAIELRKSLDYYFPNQKRIFIYSTLNTKDYKTIANILFQNTDEVYFYEFNHKNAVTFEEYIKNVSFLKNIQKLQIENLEKILNKGGLKIVTGSLYMIGSLYSKIFKPPEKI
ncbi:MAG: bifunctional folylpolyglutamate synthase/dihydrofolate synthase [Candidatus Gastranaerophilales bacterium]|nr:bifunctional folylpolyglutamate synthase/dihydrofolate synthase [Candidatus Gastranaerophilales bacterium]